MTKQYSALRAMLAVTLSSAFMLGAAATAQAASTFHFTNGCTMVCSGDWSVGSTPGTVTCLGTVTSKSASCPKFVRQTGTLTLAPNKDTGALYSLDGQPDAPVVEAAPVRQIRATKP